MTICEHVLHGYKNCEDSRRALEYFRFQLVDVAKSMWTVEQKYFVLIDLPFGL